MNRLRNADQLVKKFSQLTGIRDPRIDAWFGNQELYRVHGMSHPALAKKVEPERRSRSPMNPMLPGPRKVQNWDEELFEKWLDEKYPLPPGQTFYTASGDVFYIRDEPFDDYQPYRPTETWWKTQMDAFEPHWLMRKFHESENKRIGIGTISGIRPWKQERVAEMDEKMFKQEVKGTWGPRKENDDKGTDGEED